MCGVAGWVDFARDLRAERDTAQAMTDTMSLRGPDDEGLWLSEHAAIGHRRLAVIDIEGDNHEIAEGGDATFCAGFDAGCGTSAARRSRPRGQAPVADGGFRARALP